jgi:serine phosphatase RsbU (regulator of sigma subunit)
MRADDSSARGIQRGARRPQPRRSATTARRLALGGASGLAAAAVGALVSWALTPLTVTASLAPGVAAVAVVSMLAGTFAGLVATGLGAAAAAWLLFPPHFSLETSAGEAARTALVAGLCVIVALIGGHLRTVRSRLTSEREEHRTTAQVLQRALVPVPPVLEGLSVGQVFIPQGTGDMIGGDFLDGFMLGPGEAVLVVGDVCGKGVRAGHLASVARSAIRLAAFPGLPPEDVLMRANAEVLAVTGDSARFVAATVARVEIREQGAVIDVACAGQPPPALLRANGAVEMIGAPGMPLGLDPHPAITSVRARMRPGDVLVTYSDGVTEARSHRGVPVWGEHGLSVALSDCGGLAAPAVAEVVEHRLRERGAHRAQDDVAVLAVSLTGEARYASQIAMDLREAQGGTGHSESAGAGASTPLVDRGQSPLARVRP